MPKGIVKIREVWVRRFIKEGFPLPEDTIVLGLRYDEWNGHMFEVLVSHKDIPAVEEGCILPRVEIGLDESADKLRFSKWIPLD